MEETSEQMRPFAVITGASEGMGLELARQFAQNGYDLLIASSDEEILEVQDELEVFGTDVECIEVNLASYKGVEIFTETIRSYRRPIDVLVINASAGVEGDFLDTDLREEISLINLNIISAVHLTKNVLGDMYDNGFGRILFSSYLSDGAVYSSSKAFLSTFAESIRHEAKTHGVTVTVLLDQPQVSNDGKFEYDAIDVARQAYEATLNGVENVFEVSLVAKIQDWASKVLPERFKASYHRKMSEPHA